MQLACRAAQQTAFKCGRHGNETPSDRRDGAAELGPRGQLQAPALGPDSRMTATPLRPGPELSAAMVSHASSVWRRSYAASAAALPQARLCVWMCLAAMAAVTSDVAGVLHVGCLAAQTGAASHVLRSIELLCSQLPSASCCTRGSCRPSLTQSLATTVVIYTFSIKIDLRMEVLHQSCTKTQLFALG